jgi:hypothetical protein
MEEWGSLRGCRYLLHDRDAKFCPSFRELIKTGSVKPLRLPARSPNLNSYAERWVRSVKEECLSRLILFDLLLEELQLLQRHLQPILGRIFSPRPGRHCAAEKEENKSLSRNPRTSRSLSEKRFQRETGRLVAPQ